MGNTLFLESASHPYPKEIHLKATCLKREWRSGCQLRMPIWSSVQNLCDIPLNYLVNDEDSSQWHLLIVPTQLGNLSFPIYSKITANNRGFGSCPFGVSPFSKVTMRSPVSFVLRRYASSAVDWHAGSGIKKKRH